MSCNGCDPIGVGLVKDKSYQVSFLPSGTPSDAEYVSNENIKYAESNDIIIMQDTGDIYQCIEDRNHKKSWTLMYENVPQVSYIESGAPTDEENAKLDNVASAKLNSIIIDRSTGSQYQLSNVVDRSVASTAWVLRWKPVYTRFGAGSPTDTVKKYDVGKQYVDQNNNTIYTVESVDGVAKWVITGKLDTTALKNNGTERLDLQAIKLASLDSINVDSVPNGYIVVDSVNNQLVIKQNNQWVPLNMTNSNFEIETTYKNNTGIFPLNFTPDKLVGSSDIVSGTTGVTAGYLSLDTSKTLIMPTTTFIRVDFKISSTDTTDADYYIAGFSGNLNIRINPKQKTISVYANNTTKIYSVDYTALGINLHDDKFHTLYFLINCSYKGYTAYALDGHYFNQSTIVTVVNLTLENLRFRGATSSLLAPADVLTIKNIVLSSTLPSQVNNQAVETKFDNVEGLYSCISNDFTNSQLKNGILLKPNSTLDSVNSLKPYYTSGGNESLFNSDGLYGGVMSLNTTLDIDTFTLECYFKYDSSLDTDTTIARAIIGNIDEGFVVGIPYLGKNNITFSDQKGTNLTLTTNITKDVWHTLAISVNKSVMNIFIDGQLKATTPYKYNLHNLYIRGLRPTQFIPKLNVLTIKNVSFLVGRAKYFEDYDSSLTPTEPGDDGFFYALSNSLISNGNQLSPVVNLILGADGEVTLMTLPNNETPSTLQLPKIAYDADNKPSLVNTKLSNIFMYNITGNPVKESV